MNKLKKINARIATKQKARLIIGALAYGIGFAMFYDRAYQTGITDYQNNISKAFPEEYNAMLEKTIEFLDNE